VKKVVIIAILVALLGGAGVVYYRRHEILQVSAETVIRKNLPPYMAVKEILFDFQKSILRLKGITVKNPPGYSNKFLVTINEVSCKYRKKGNTLFDGIEVTRIIAAAPVINIDRTRDGRINTNDMGKVIGSGKSRKRSVEKKSVTPSVLQARKSADAGGGILVKKATDLIKLPGVIDIEDGSIVFMDEYRFRRLYRLAVEDINGELAIKLSEDYREVFSVASRGSGLVNGDGSQLVSWDVSLDPTAEELTMMGTYKLRGVDITQFRPYYDEYSPVAIESGRCSGTLVFNFDNGNIGSTNTLQLTNFRFRVKSGNFGARYWAVAIPEVIKYLESSPGEIIFDFKIKGNMKDPRFYPGPHVEKAIQNVAIDKISEVMKGFNKQEGESEPGGQSDVDKVVNIMRSFLNK